MAATPAASIATPRDDIGLFFEAIDLDAIHRGYIGFLVAPLIEATLRRGQYSYRNIGDVLQKTTSADRTEAGGFNRISSRFRKGTYAVESKGLEESVDNLTEAEYLGMIDSEMIAAEATRHGVIEDHELRVIAAINAVAVAETLAAGEQWTNDASDPVSDFVRWKRVFRLQCGVQPNCLVLDQTAVDCLAANPSVVEAAGRAGSNVRDALEFNDVNRELRRRAIAVALGINEIVESGGMQNTAGQPLDASLATTFPEDKAVLMRKDTGPSTRGTQWLRTVHWSGNGSRPGCAFEQYDEPQTDSRVIRHRMDTAVITINSEAVMVLDEVVDLSGLVAS